MILWYVITQYADLIIFIRFWSKKTTEIKKIIIILLMQCVEDVRKQRKYSSITKIIQILHYLFKMAASGTSHNSKSSLDVPQVCTQYNLLNSIPRKQQGCFHRFTDVWNLLVFFWSFSDYTINHANESIPFTLAGN